MAREASHRTVFIRSLCEQTRGEIPYSEARPKLNKKGYDLPPDAPEDVAAYLMKFTEICDSHEHDPNNADHIKDLRNKTAKALKWTPAKVATTMREVEKYEAEVAEVTKAQRNSFDVTKNQWKIANGLTGTGSAKPNQPKADPKAKVAAKHGRTATHTVIKAPKAKNTPVTHDDELAALDFIEKNGGVAAVMEKVNTLNEEVADLTAKLEMVANLTERLKSAA